MSGNSTVESRFKDGVQYGLKHTRTRKKYFLIPQTKLDIFHNKKRRCSGCSKPVEQLSPDRGFGADPRRPIIALHCPRCEVIFPAYRQVVSTIE